MSDLIGKDLGRYHILEQLGEGGMATVFKAFDTRLERDVAVKIIRTENLSPARAERALQRFKREANALAKLTHPNIIKVTDYGEYEAKPYLVMPFLSGGTLKQRLQGKRMPWQDAVSLLLPIARALAYAHKQGMIHRDIKPSNILITESGDPLLIDFGIAKLMDDDTAMELTGTRATVGTPEYMAPEQVTSKFVDARADIYAFGVVFYEMITGRKPFQADTPMAVLFKHANDPLPRPTEFVHDLPNSVEKALLKALAKKPDDRYQSMDEFVAAMEQLGQKVQAPPKSVQPIVPAAVNNPLPSVSSSKKIPSHPTGSISIKRTWSLAGVIGLFGFIGLAAIGTIFLLRAIPQNGRSPSATSTPQPLEVNRDNNLPTIEATVAPTEAEIQTEIPLATSIPTPAADRFSGLPVISIKNAAKMIQLEQMEGSQSQFFLEAVAFSPDGSILASTDGKTVELWRVSDGILLRILEGHTDWVDSIAFSPDGTTLASGSADNTVNLWRVSDGALLRTLQGHASVVTSVVFSPDGGTLASGSWDNTVKLWRVSDGILMRTLTGHTDWVDGIAFSPDGTTLASGSQDTSLKLWRVSNGELLMTLNRHSGGIAFSPDGTMLASGSSDDYGNTLKLWRISDRALLFTLSGYKGSIPSVTFSPDGTILASGSADNSIKLWRVFNGALLSTLQGHTSGVSSVAFSPDGRLLASGSDDRTIRLWGVKE
jgi:serine/threonine protein kinase